MLMGYQDDYNQTIFLNAYGNAKPLRKNDEYQRYFTYECGITNPRAYHEQLISKGFLIPCSANDALKGFKLAELKELCDAFSIVKTGKKQDIIDRIVQNVSPDLLKKYTEKEKCYSLSEIGRDFVAQHKDYIEFHKNTLLGISLEEYEREKAISSESDFYKIALRLLSKRLDSTNTDGFRNTYYSIAQIHSQTNDMTASLKNLLYVLFFDVNWTPNQSVIANLAHSDDITEYYHFSGFAPGLIKDITNLKDYYKKQMVDDIYETYSHMSPYVCPKALFLQLIDDIYSKPVIDSEQYAKIFKENFASSIKTPCPKNRQESTKEYQTGNAGCMATIIVVVVFLILALLFFM